jgi:integrase
VAAIREALAARPEPRDKVADAQTAFLQPSGRRWVRHTESSRSDNVGVRFAELLKRKGLYRDGIGFYALRHVFRTVADAARDPVATDLIMGHADPSMGGHYRERIEDSRLRAVAEHVRQWLFGSAPDDGKTETATSESSALADTHQESEGGGGRPTLRLFAG